MHDLDNGTLHPTSYCPEDKRCLSFRSSCEPEVKGYNEYDRALENLF